jgi:serine/threonine protein kinase
MTPGQDQSAPLPIQRIGKYEITSRLGAGGFGSAYSALDPTMGRVVAIKLLNAPHDPNIVRRRRTTQYPEPLRE